MSMEGSKGEDLGKMRGKKKRKKPILRTVLGDFPGKVNLPPLHKKPHNCCF